MENNNIEQEILEKENNEPKRNIRDSLYGKIDVSLKNMDRFITVLLVMLGLAITLGIVIK
ncbi:hypothetical protein K5V21_02755 [Clostridium sardiniense]|uniref:Uncharacterized protein n=1 Tax=Clostridium sardiniense TaxID=29369 RepID=A0ABS7KUV5_CLOSR|nr:hypothetical protein [Clostridium sardiniense]MBY0754368.1 hypothetical protein [Clostridium sardiniense]MDQ0462029.1 hypothetical protein [Clostridium sardiniense]